MKKARVPEKYRCQKPSRFCLDDCPHREPHTLRDNCLDEQGSCPGCIPIKPRWGGLPDSRGFWEWKWRRAAKAFLVLWVDGFHRVHFPVPKENTVVGYFYEPIGRTVRTIGGVWGRRVAD